MQDMLEMFRAIRINLPLLDAIRQVSAYARFLKELCTKKRRSRKVPECVLLSEETSSLHQRRLPPKLEDPGAPIILCVLGNIRVERALLDLGASVNILPGYFYDMFNLEGLKPTSMTIQMADRSVKAPRGVLEDVLLRIEDFVFPVDFVILDMKGANAENQTPIILGRPFLATANACINCRTGVLEISFGDRKLRLNIFHAAMGPVGDRCISFAEAEDEDVDEAAHEVCMAVFTSSISDPGPDFLPGVDGSAKLFDSSSLGFHHVSDLGFDFSSYDNDSIITSIDHISSPVDLASFHSLSFEEREADGGYDVLATTTLHRNRSHPTAYFDASDFAIGAILGQRVEKKPVVIYYTSKTLIDAQMHYTTTEKELLAVVFALEKFRSYILGSRVVVYTDHAALKYFLSKKDSKPRLIRWILLLQEFDIKIKDKKGSENVVADHLSRVLVGSDRVELPISNLFPDESLFGIMSMTKLPWYADYCNFLVTKEMPSHWSKN
ncbi:unnamed protein product [Victoria cruziana]